MNTKTIVWVGIYGVIAYGIYYMVKNMHITSREKSVLAILGRNYSGMEDGFLKEWAKGIKMGETEFSYKGKVYLTEGGRAKK